MSEILIRILARNMPTAWCREHGVAHLAITKSAMVVEPTSTNQSSVEFSATVEVVEKPTGPDFRGPYVFGKVGERFLYLNWGSQTGIHWVPVGRIKLQLCSVDSDLIDAAVDGQTLIADLDLSTDKGGPVFATVRPPMLTWRCAS